MSHRQSGIATSIFLLVAGLAGPVPENWLACGVLLALAFAVERKGFEVLASYRFSPSTPLILGGAAVPGVGALPGLIAIIIDAMYRVESSFLLGLSQRISVAVGLLTGAVVSRVSEGDLAVTLGAICAAYALTRLTLDTKLNPPSQEDERVVWRQLHLQIRPLEIGLTFLVAVAALLIQQSVWLALLLVPLLLVMPLAAESVLQRSQQETVSKTIKELKSVTAKGAKKERELQQARTQKQLLENFAEHLSKKPNLTTTAQSLVITTLEVTPAENVVVFLGEPPEPFSYQATPDHSTRLQGSLLTGLVEPVVLEAKSTGKSLFRSEEPSEDRLLQSDSVVAAIPLGEIGVLYVGTSQAGTLTKSHKSQLLWLAEKATLALEVSYKNQLERQAAQAKERAVESLTEHVDKLSVLLNGATAMASSLDQKELRKNLQQIFVDSIPHDGGYFLKEGSLPKHWGEELKLTASAQKALSERQMAVLLRDAKEVRESCGHDKMASLIAAPLLVGKKVIGVAAVASKQPGAYDRGMRDQFFLLCSQAAMAFSNASLYQDVVKARKELEESQARLVQSSKMTALGQLSAGVAHELNSPLGAISLCIDEVADLLESNPGLAKTMLGGGQKAVERCQKIIDRLMAYSRKSEQRFRPICLRELADDTVDFLNYQLKSAQVRAKVLGEGSFPIDGEYQALQQVLTNLIINATQAMENSEDKLIDMSLSKSEEFVSLSIRDRGTGISEENLERVFNPFFTTKPPGKGTGLGLWASHEVVEQHGGRLEVESTLGEGATFTLTLPKKKKSDIH